MPVGQTNSRYSDLDLTQHYQQVQESRRHLKPSSSTSGAFYSSSCNFTSITSLPPQIIPVFRSATYYVMLPPRSTSNNSSFQVGNILSNVASWENFILRTYNYIVAHKKVIISSYSCATQVASTMVSKHLHPRLTAAKLSRMLVA